MLRSYREVLVFFISLILLTSAIVFSSFFASNEIKSAFGDGLTQEQLSASMGNRKADLLIKMIPPVVTTETLQKGQNPIVEFRLFDPNTNQSFSHVTYYITIEKGGKKLLSEWFHAHNGDLGIKMEPNSTNKTITVYGEQDPVQYTYIGTPSNPVIASGPIFLDGGLYHFIVKIETIDSDESYLPPDKQPVYDSWLSIGNTENKQINIGGKQIPIKIISYYDRLNNFGFDNKNMQMQFDMPFNWNLSRLNKANIFVHEEVNVPKPNAFTTKGSYVGKVNGIDISKNVMLDNTNHSKDVIHVMIPKNTVIQLADQVNKNGQASAGLMKFTLQPGMRSVASNSNSNSMGSMSMSSMGSMTSGK
jgi:hypothetical protein